MDALCDVFVKYHRDRSIVPRPKQRCFFAEDHRGEGPVRSRLGTDAAREGSFNLRTASARVAATPRGRARVDASRPSISRSRGSAQGKTKVILPLFCMAFLSSNKAVRDALSARRAREALFGGVSAGTFGTRTLAQVV